MPTSYEIWNDYEGAAGAVRLQFVADMKAASCRISRTAESSATFTLPYASVSGQNWQELSVVRVVEENGRTRSWRIREIDDSRAMDAMVTLICDAMAVDLTDKAIIERAEANGARNPSFEGLGLTIQQHWDNFLNASMVNNGVLYFKLGTVEFDGPVNLVYDRDTPMAALKRIAPQIGLDLAVEQMGPLMLSGNPTRASSTVTVTTAAAHGLTTGQRVRVTGGDQPEYDGIYTITVTGSTTFTYTITGTPASPATGTLSIVPLVQEVSLIRPTTVVGTQVDIRTSRNLLSITRKRSAVEQANRIHAYGTVIDNLPCTLARNRWKVLSQPSSTVVHLCDPLMVRQGISGITRSGTTATVTTSSNHGLSTGDTVQIGGANQDEYNGLFQITVTGLATFTITVAATAVTPATGTMAVGQGGGWGPIRFANQVASRYGTKVPGGTPVQISACDVTQKVTFSGSHGLVVGDLIEINLNASGGDLTYLEDPGSQSTYKLKIGKFDRVDIPDTVNIFSNPDQQIPIATGYTAVQVNGTSATLTDETNVSFWKSGGRSLKVVCTGDGQGADTTYAPFTPVQLTPYFSAFATLLLATAGGSVRLTTIIGLPTTTSISSVTRSTTNGLTTVTVNATAHGLAVGDFVEITGVTPAAYSAIVKVAAVTSANAFTFLLSTDPGAASVSSALARKVWLYPDGNTAIARTNVLNQFVDLGVQGINAFAVGAGNYVAKLRMVQDGSTNVTFYVDFVQGSQTPQHRPAISGAGATQLWQVTNEELVRRTQPIVRVDIKAIDLERLDPAAYAMFRLNVGTMVHLYDPEMGIDITTRILEYGYDYMTESSSEITLSSRPEDFVDAQVRPRIPTRPLSEINTDIDLSVQWVITAIAETPASRQVRLATRSGLGTIYYISQTLGQTVPPIGTAAWTQYTAPFGVQLNQSADIQISAYAQNGQQVSPVATFVIDKEALPTANATILETPAANNYTITWTITGSVRMVRVYLLSSATGHWPVVTQSVGITRSGAVMTVTTPTAHNLVVGDTIVITGATQTEYNGAKTVASVVNETQFTAAVSGTPASPATGSPIFSSPRGVPDESRFIAQKSVDPNGGGFLASGAPTSGGMSVTGSGLTSTHTARAIVIPFNKDLVTNTAYRGASSMTVVGVVPAYISLFTAVRTSNGSACDTANGADVLLSWTPNNVVDGTHDLDLSVGGVSVTEVNPNSVTSRTIRIPFKVTTGKFDPSIVLTATYVLRDGSGTIDSGSRDLSSFLSTCAV